MKRFAFVVVLVLITLVASVGAKPIIGRADWSTYAPDQPLQIHHAYISPYTEVVWVADKITRLDGSQWLILENLRGRLCKTDSGVCAVPADWPRGVLVEVPVTVAPDDPDPTEPEP